MEGTGWTRGKKSTWQGRSYLLRLSTPLQWRTPWSRGPETPLWKELARCPGLPFWDLNGNKPIPQPGTSPHRRGTHPPLVLTTLPRVV